MKEQPAALLMLAGYAGFLLRERLSDLPDYCRQGITESGDDTAGQAGDSALSFQEAYWRQALELIAAGAIDEEISMELESYFPAAPESSTGLPQMLHRVMVASQLRRKALLHFAGDYAKDAQTLLLLAKEIDTYCSLYDQQSTQVFISRIQNRGGEDDTRYLEVQKTARIGHWSFNRTTRDIYWSDEVYHIYGLQPKTALTTELIRSFIDEDDLPVIAQKIIYAIQSKKPFSYISSIFLPDGSEKILEVNGSIRPDNPEQLSGTIQDVTHEQLLIRRLQESERGYMQMKALAHMGNWSMDVSTGEVTWCDEMYRLYGFNTVENRPDIASIRAFTDAADAERAAVIIGKCLSHGEPYEIDYHVTLPDGSRKVLRGKGEASRNAQGKIVRLFGTVQDVTVEQDLLKRLQDSETLYREAQSIAGIGNFRQDMTTGSLYWSDELYRIYDLEPQSMEMTRELIAGYTHPDDLEGIMTAYTRYKGSAGSRHRHAYRIITKAGRTKWIQVYWDNILDKQGNELFIKGTVQDITESRQLIEQLRRSDSLYRQAQAMTRLGNWMLDITSGIASFSDEVIRIHGLEGLKERPALEDVYARIHPQDADILKLHIERCIRSSIPYDFHYRITGGTAGEKVVRTKGEALPGSDGIARTIFGTIQDVTEQKNVERRLRENQRFAEKISDATPAVITVLNVRTGQYMFINKMIETLLGYTQEEATAGGFAFMLTLLHPDDTDQVLAENNAALNAANAGDPDYPEDRIIEFRYRMRHKNGDWRWFQTYAIIFDRNDDGVVEHVLNVSIDSTSTARAEQLLSQKNTLLLQSNSSLEEFAYIASHDLQEPLRKISTFGNMLETLQEDNMSASGRLYLRKIVESAIRMQSMINDLLSVSLISGNKSFADESLQTLLEEGLMPLDHKIEQTGAVIETPQPLPHAHVVAAQFRQLFQNLAGNSLKFRRTDVSSVIRITYDYIRGDEVLQAGLSGTRQYLRLIFTDNGIGFSNEYAGRIFAIFQRLHGKSEYEGTGIGLAMVKKIVEHHKGVITANGVPGEGATFTIVIPA